MYTHQRRTLTTNRSCRWIWGWWYLLSFFLFSFLSLSLNFWTHRGSDVVSLSIYLLYFLVCCKFCQVSIHSNRMALKVMLRSCKVTTFCNLTEFQVKLWLVGCSFNKLLQSLSWLLDTVQRIKIDHLSLHPPSGTGQGHVNFSSSMGPNVHQWASTGKWKIL